MIDKDSRPGARVLVAAGLLVDAAAMAGMCAAIVLTSGAALAVSLVAGNVLLVAGTLVAYRGRIRGERE